VETRVQAVETAAVPEGLVFVLQSGGLPKPNVHRAGGMAEDRA